MSKGVQTGINTCTKCTIYLPVSPVSTRYFWLIFHSYVFVFSFCAAAWLVPRKTLEHSAPLWYKKWFCWCAHKATLSVVILLHFTFCILHYHFCFVWSCISIHKSHMSKNNTEVWAHTDESASDEETKPVCLLTAGWACTYAATALTPLPPTPEHSENPKSTQGRAIFFCLFVCLLLWLYACSGKGESHATWAGWIFLLFVFVFFPYPPARSPFSRKQAWLPASMARI